jgi:transcription elongation GreA/GreB family factor
MSRAFVKEDDSAPPEQPLERPVSSAPNQVTPRGARLIDEEIDRLERAIADEPDEEKTAPSRRDLRYWLARRASAQLLAPDPEPEAAGFGTRVRIRRGGVESEILIVGEDEADPDSGLIAWTSPLAQALEEGEPGDVVELAAGGRTVPIAILSVAAGEDDKREG